MKLHMMGLCKKPAIGAWSAIYTFTRCMQMVHVEPNALSI